MTSLITESDLFRETRKVAKDLLGDTIDIWCHGSMHADVKANFRYNESVEFFEDLKAKSRDLHLLIYCDELDDRGIQISDLGSCSYFIRSKFLGDRYYEANDVLQQSTRRIKIMLSTCSEARLEKSTGQRVSNATKNKGRIRNPYKGCSKYLG